MTAEDHEFSSFAELVGLIRAVDLALAPGPDSDPDAVISMAANLDATAASWMLLLPASKKSWHKNGGIVDQLLFIANAYILT